MIRAVVNGLWSGYPLCCVLYYVRLDRHGPPAEIDCRARGVDPAEEWLADGGEAGPQYVRCPTCRRRGRVVPLADQRKGGL